MIEYIKIATAVVGLFSGGYDLRSKVTAPEPVQPVLQRVEYYQPVYSSPALPSCRDTTCQGKRIGWDACPQIYDCVNQ